ncbi:MAG: hypothetical protein C4K60_09935 [Ideonella sp. MAG2]|nr:MAG: hypothetical protein C4K60_09935 [Ideonella sp. MAG2]
MNPYESSEGSDLNSGLRSQRPRIAILYDCVFPYVPGGGQKRLFEICRRLVAMGWQVDWYGLKSWEQTGEVQVEGIRFIPVAPSVPMYSESGKRSISQTLYYGRAVAKVSGLGSYDVVHLGQWPYFHFFPAWLYTRFGKAHLTADWWEIWGRHWTEYYGAKGWLGMVLERLCARIPAKLVAISEMGARQLGGIGVVPRRLQVIHNGIDCRRILSVAAAAQQSDLIYVGRLQPHKNVDCLLKALPHLERLKERAFSLTIVGDGPERASLEQLSRELGIQDRVKFLGSIAADDDVYAQIKAARVFVHPSTKEGGGSITSLEANAAGLPVVAFRHEAGLSPELIVDGVNGAWVDQVGPQHLAEGIARALDLQDNRGTAQRCVEFAGQFDWDILARQYHQLFQGLLR